MRGIILRIIRQMGNDKRTLALMLVAPLVILSLLYLLMGESSYQPVIGVPEGFPDVLSTALEKQNVRLYVLAPGEDGDALLKSKSVDVIASVDLSGAHIRMLEMDSVKTQKITLAMKEAMTSLIPMGKVELTFLYGGSGETGFDSLGYVLLGVLSFFFVFIIAGITFVRERENGTLERLMTTPVHRWQVVGGYTVGFGVFAAAQGVLIILFTTYALGLHMAGSVLLAALLMILLAFTAVSAGALASIFANNEFQVMQFIPIVIIPQIFFAGLLPIDTLPYGLGSLAYVMPLYYGCMGLKGVLIQGAGVRETIGFIGMLVGFTALFSLLNVIALKRYRVV